MATIEIYNICWCRAPTGATEDYLNNSTDSSYNFASGNCVCGRTDYFKPEPEILAIDGKEIRAGWEMGNSKDIRKTDTVAKVEIFRP